MSHAILTLILAFFLSSAAQAQLVCSDIFSSNQFKGEVTFGQSQYGQSLFYKADPGLRGPLQKHLRFGTYNLLNLFDHVMIQESTGTTKKPSEKRMGNARAIETMDPDFMIGVEIENIHAFKLFNETYLKNQYEPLLIEGNDSRGIDVGILIKKDLPIEMEWRSFKNFSPYTEQAIFSRDLPVGLVYERDANGLKQNHPKFAIIATHYKSKRTNPGQPDTSTIRARQVQATLEVIKIIQKEFGDNLPILLSGDFNNSLHTSYEFKSLFAEGFQDTLDLAPQKASLEERATHYYFDRKGNREANQMDGILILANHQMNVVQSKVIPDTDSLGRVLPAPKTFFEREQRPSDHRPISAEIEFNN